jgi:hypothetical protein
MEYARILGEEGGTDTVTVHALGADGNEVEAMFLLNSGSVLMSESSSTDILAPDSTDAIPLPA